MLITSWALIVWPRSWFHVVGLCEISSGPAPSQRMTRDDMLKHSMSLPTFETLVTLQPLQPVTLRQTLHSLCVQRGRKKAELEELLDSEANSRARHSENAMNNAMKWIAGDSMWRSLFLPLDWKEMWNATSATAQNLGAKSNLEYLQIIRLGSQHSEQWHK